MMSAMECEPRTHGRVHELDVDVLPDPGDVMLIHYASHCRLGNERVVIEYGENVEPRFVRRVFKVDKIVVKKRYMNASQIRVLFNEIAPNLADERKSLVYLHEGSFSCSHSVVATAFFRRFRHACKLKIVSKNPPRQIPFEVRDAMDVNAEYDIPNTVVVPFEDDTHIIIPTEGDEAPDFDVDGARTFLLEYYGDSIMVDQSYDAEIIRNNDLYTDLTAFSYDDSRRVYVPRRYDYMRPVLQTPMPHPREPTLHETILAFNKRNGAVPMLTGSIDIDKTGLILYESFMHECTTAEYKTFEEIRLSEYEIDLWLQKQGLVDKTQIVPEMPLELTSLDHLNFLIKRTVKPSLKLDAAYVYQSLQTIVHHPKHVNAQFGPIVNEITIRIREHLLPHIIFYTSMSTTDFSEHLERLETPYFAAFSGDDSIIYNGIRGYEFDFSKYDKSQREVILECLMRIFIRFGMDKRRARMWYFVHLLSYVSDLSTGLKAVIMYMMRSGVVVTWLGNTCAEAAVISSVLPLRDGLYGCRVEEYRMPELMSLAYNLEVKLLSHFQFMYFCSKFLLRVHDRWHFVGDPLKLIVRLGRHDIVNYAHLELMRQSMVDHAADYRSFAVCIVLAEAVRDRYGVQSDFSLLFHSVSTLARKDIFSSLYYTAPDDKLDHTRMQFYDER